MQIPRAFGLASRDDFPAGWGGHGAGNHGDDHVHRMTTMAALAAGLLAAGLLAAGAALAQQAPDAQTGSAKHQNWAAVRAACAADFKTYCAGQTGHANRHACIEQNRAKFSSGCQDAMTAAHHSHDSQSPPAQ